MVSAREANDRYSNKYIQAKVIHDKQSCHRNKDKEAINSTAGKGGWGGFQETMEKSSFFFFPVEMSTKLFLKDKVFIKKKWDGNSRAVQWLGLHAFTAKGTGSIPGWGTKILQGRQHGKTFFFN